MAYQSSVAELRCILQGGIANQPSSGAELMKGGSLYTYCSCHASSDITGAGFFAGVGATPRSTGGGQQNPNIVARSTKNVDVRPGDVIMNIESSAGVVPGRVSLHGVNASTFNGSTNTWAASNGYDVTVALAATT